MYRSSGITPIILLAIIILFSGCTFLSGDDTDDGNVTYREVINSEGIKASFVSLPKAVQVGQEFDIVLALENRGEHILNPNELSVAFSGGSYNFSGQTKSYDLSTLDSVFISQEGETKVVGIEPYWDVGKTKYVGSDLPGNKFNIIAEYCYLYTTVVTKQACIVGINDDVCEPNNRVDWLTSGPIWVTDIEQKSIKHITEKTADHRFKVYVKNKGVGQVFPVDTNCRGAQGITLSKVTMAGSEEDITDKCNLGNPVLIIDEYVNEGTIDFMCEIETTSSVGYLTPIEFEFEYAYKEQISTSIDIES